MNLPNKLTISRFFLTMIFVATMSVPFHYSKCTALVLFILAGFTDYLDGEIARKYNLISDFGKLMDPLVDKIMTAAAFICLVPLHAIPAWAAIVMISREFLITGLRLLASSKGKILPAEKLGKHKTTWQIVTILFFLILLAARDFFENLETNEMYQWAWDSVGLLLLTITVALTIYSGMAYMWKNRELISTR